MNRDNEGVFVFIVILCLVAFGTFGIRTAIKLGNEARAEANAKRKEAITFCQSLTVPNESNACLARLAMENK